MSVVSAGGRRSGSRSSGRDMRWARRTAQSDIVEPFIPRFSAVLNEGRTVSPPKNEWGENTTVLTGATSELSFNEPDKPVFEVPVGRLITKKCSRFCWLMLATLISFLAIISAPLMCSIPFILDLYIREQPVTVCDMDCQGYLLLLVIKTFLLIVALSALHWRKAAADFPRLYFARISLTFFVAFILFAYWLFFCVRVLFEQRENYTYIVTFSLSLLDALLYSHYISVIVLELRKLRPMYTVTIVRDPDGETHSVKIGEMALQEAGIEILRVYNTVFSSFNPALHKVKFGKPNVISANSGGFKMYNIEGFDNPRDTLSEVNARALLEAASRRRHTGHNEMLQDEVEWDRRLKKRKYRLIVSTEDAFAHVQTYRQTPANQTRENVLADPMDSWTAAQSVFTLIVRPLNKYLKITRQLHKHSSDSVTQHIERCLSLKLSARTFLQRFFSARYPCGIFNDESKWSIISDEQACSPVQHNTTFLLRSHTKDDDAGVQLLCTVTRLPFFNLTEQSNISLGKFALKVRNESSV
ncbi:unnamed protein product [Auanema sp. JU1783]|nr:unnamed protein product [Auanema sp. JU1783]